MKRDRGDIELAGVCKSFDGVTNVVDGVNLKIADGAYCCFIGPSGCGKTTILRMIAGHEDPTAGEIVIGGQNVVGLAPVQRRTAMMFQSYDGRGVGPPHRRPARGRPLLDRPVGR